MGSGDSLQAVVDSLAERLGLSVLIEDASFHALSWSVQTEVDDVRLHSILRRGVTAATLDAVDRLGLARATTPVRTPAVPEAGMEQRWCVPLRVAEHLAGYLWVLDPQDRAGPDALPALASAADRAIGVIASEAAPEDDDRQLRDLLGRLERGPDEEAARRLTILARLPDRALIVVDEHPRSDGWPLAGGLTALPVGAGHPGATSGPPLPLVELREAVRRARLTLQALRAGALLSRPSWDCLHAWRMVAEAPPELDPAEIHPGVDALRRQKTLDLLITARTFLDLGGDVQATAHALHLHRTTLYYRLDRIRALTSVDLRTGAARHDLDLALRLTAFREAAGP
ncbi:MULTISPECIES: helix-turn-helix domain-containing protein [unclassified Streptomyces]|uniref:helix-turn-helix domain-containing protein n=1 Tax=unclassified Streptomyces TaxID=2593676 RepID=UPI002E783C80|nr:helix-turn-helix domain-containing protein [Streptomyces sp. JV176]MEE1801129.1 helix-turn-helix domain-containing protein [Streptomyces sp. JV176]